MKEKILSRQEKNSIPDWLRTARERESIAWVCFWGNLGLAVLKVIAALFYGDSLILSDGIHSAANAVMVIIMLAGIKASETPPDGVHRFGHGKAEYIFSTAAGILVITAGVFMVISAFEGVSGGYENTTSFVGIFVSFNSIIANLVLYQYAKNRGVELKSRILKDNSYHNYLNAITSSIALVGSILLMGLVLNNFGYYRLEQAALITIALVILYAGIVRLKIGINGVMDKLSSSQTPERLNEVMKLAIPVSGVKRVEDVKIKRIGDRDQVYMEVLMNRNINLQQAHDICRRIKEKVIRNLSYVDNVFIDFKPANV